MLAAGPQEMHSSDLYSPFQVKNQDLGRTARMRGLAAVLLAAGPQETDVPNLCV